MLPKPRLGPQMKTVKRLANFKIAQPAQLRNAVGKVTLRSKSQILCGALAKAPVALGQLAQELCALPPRLSPKDPQLRAVHGLSQACARRSLAS